MRVLATLILHLSELLRRPELRNTIGRRKGRGLLLATLGATLVASLAAASPARANAPTAQVGAASPLQPPAAALQPNGAAGAGARGLGLAQPPGTFLAARPASAAAAAGTAPLPASVDLSQYNPPVGDQGAVSSCASWATGYYLRGWYARRDGYYPAGGPGGTGSFAPMYLYSQITQGQNAGTTYNANLDLEVAQGIDTRADYTQGDTNYTNLPTAAEQANAANYKIAGYTTLFLGNNQGPAAQQAIEASMAGGDPVALGIPVYDNFWNANATNYYVDVSNLGTTYYGNHAVFASKYDANGVWIENQWGTGWGLNGWAELSWAFVEQYVWQAVTMRPGTSMPATATPTMASDTPTATNTATPLPPTATSTPPPATPTSTPTPVLPTATNTATPVPPTRTATPIPPTPTATNTATPIPATSTAAATRHAARSQWRSSRRRAGPRYAGHVRASSTVHRTRPLHWWDIAGRGHRHDARFGPHPALVPRLAHGSRRGAPTAGYSRATHHGARHGRRHGVTYRVVVVPAHARRVWLHFSYRAIGAAQRGSPGQSWLEVDVLSPRSHRALARILRVALVPADRGWPWDRERTAPGPWHHVTVDLTHFRGRRVWLCFRVDHRRGVAPALVDVSGLRITTH